MKPNTRQSRPKLRSNERNRYLSGSRLRSQRVSQLADEQSGRRRRRPRASMLSVSSCRTTRMRPAPSASRVAISLRRRRGARQQQPRDVGAGDQQHDADRGEWQVRETAQRCPHVRRHGPGPAPRRTPARALVSGIGPLQSRRNRRELARAPVRAWRPARASRTSRAMTRRRCPNRAAIVGFDPAQRRERHPEIARRADLDARERLAGHADDVKSCPSSLIVVPMTDGSPAKRRCQSRWLTHATASAPASRSSAGDINRPCAAVTPSTSK